MFGLTKAIRVLGAVVLLALSTPLQADDFKITDLQWLTGLWRAQSGDTQMEEMYLPIRSQEILATLTVTAEGRVRHYELRSFRKQEGKLVLQIYAARSNFSPIDAPVSVRIATFADANRIVFDGITMERTGPNSMVTTVSLPRAKQSMRLEFQRVMNLVPRQ